MTMITKAMLKKDLVRVANKLRNTPTRAQYRSLGNFASDTVERNFNGSWTKALRAARV